MDTSTEDLRTYSNKSTQTSDHLLQPSRPKPPSCFKCKIRAKILNPFNGTNKDPKVVQKAAVKQLEVQSPAAASVYRKLIKDPTGVGLGRGSPG